MDDTTDMRYLLLEDQLRAAAQAQSSLFALQQLYGAVEMLDQLLASEVHRARETGASWEGIAESFGMSRQAAWSRWAGTSPRRS